MFNVLVTGANGQLGSEIGELSSLYDYRFFFTGSYDLDITDKAKVEFFCKEHKINTIINCAAYTSVDKAESEPMLADQINHLAVKNLANTAQEQNIKLIHVSTDYIFDGTNSKPYVETDIPNPQGVYGQTKLDGEKEILKINPNNSMIVRTSWVYSSFGNNFVKTMLKLGKERDALSLIYDQIGTPTYAKDLAQMILDTIPQLSNSKVAIYNYSNEGVCSWYDFAKAIFKINDIDCNINPIETKEYPTPAKRPHYSLINKAKIKNEYNIIIPYWYDSLLECLERMGEVRR
jgi:dTDP-4-dehydrorhamnose reductase